MLSNQFNNKSNIIYNPPAISKISFGGGTLGGFYGNIDLSQAIETIRSALKKGMNLFDTSPYYGNSEEVLGKCLKALKPEFPRSQYWISTKVGRYGPETFDYTKETVRKSIMTSLELLDTDYLDIAYCHDVEFVTETEVLDEALVELFRLKEEGLVKHVGISGYPLDILKSLVIKSHKKGQPLDAILSYCHYTLQNSLLLDSNFSSELKNQYGVKHLFNASPLSMGLLSDSKAPIWHPAPTKLKILAQKCLDLCVFNNQPMAELALAYSLMFPKEELTSTVVGCISQKEVNQAMETFKNVEQGFYEKGLKVELLKKCSEILKPYHNFTWSSPSEEYQRK